MNSIEQRVLIPGSPQMIWEYLSDLRNNAQWQVNCRNLAFLTTEITGRGTRYRYQTLSGREQVAEITAWYKEVGYEYVIVDGAPFTSNKGRIKLHETAEGTVVHWTFDYALKGIFSGLRNAISTQRTIENDIIESLWMLWENITQGLQERERFVGRTVMRDAPDVEERAQYQARYPSKFGEKFERPPLPIEEPPISDEDTRPRPALQPEVISDEPEETPEPDFLQSVPPSESAQTAEQFEIAESEDDISIEDDYLRFTRPETVPPVESKESVKDTHETPAVTVDEPLPVEEVSPPQPVSTFDNIADIDASEKSIFEIFGVPKPSETQETTAVSPSPTAEDDVVTTSDETETGEPTLPSVTTPVEPVDETDIPSTVEKAPDTRPVELPTRSLQPLEEINPPTDRKGLRVVLRRRQSKTREPE
jgi:hypothetical protein